MLVIAYIAIHTAYIADDWRQNITNTFGWYPWSVVFYNSIIIIYTYFISIKYGDWTVTGEVISKYFWRQNVVYMITHFSFWNKSKRAIILCRYYVYTIYQSNASKHWNFHVLTILPRNSLPESVFQTFRFCLMVSIWFQSKVEFIGGFVTLLNSQDVRPSFRQVHLV